MRNTRASARPGVGGLLIRRANKDLTPLPTAGLVAPRDRLMNDFPGTFREGLPTHLAASGFAGFCCSATSNPIDVVKASCSHALLFQDLPAGMTASFIQLYDTLTIAPAPPYCACRCA